MTKLKSLPLLALLLSTFLPLAGCATDGADALDDEALASEAAAVSADVPEYLVARRDVRRCASPMCGGLFVRAANGGSLICADGSEADECYVAEASYTGVHFDAGEASYFDERLRSGLAIVKGTVGTKHFRHIGKLGLLKVTEAWDAWTDQPVVGTIHEFAPTGMMCITTPCFTLEATPLDADATCARKLSGFDVSKLNVAEELKVDIINLAYSERLFAAGEIVTVPDNGSIGTELQATQVFKRLFHKVDVAGSWRFIASDRGRYNYTFNADGTFASHQEPGCLYSTPRCAVRMAFLGGTYVVDGDRVQLTYTSSIRNGETAEFVIQGSGSSTRLVGKDFDRVLKLKRLAQ